MKVFTKIVDLQDALSCDRKQHSTIGFVPTMGALHAGHASLVERSVKDNDVTVVSIFLNPTQFNDKSDLEHYPQTLEADCEMLEKVGADYVFAPSVNEIYPTPDTRVFDFPPVTTVMEGAKRPGHFNGVCQVVSRLFDIVQPDKAYFGEKDWQQIAVIKRLVEFMGSNIEIVECPIVREESGLAMSSRNETRNWVISDINAHEGLEVEYFSIVDGLTLTDLDNWNDSPYVVGCITVYCGETPIRLIDHIKYKG